MTGARGGGVIRAGLVLLVLTGSLSGCTRAGGEVPAGADGAHGGVPHAGYRAADWADADGHLRCPSGFSNGASPPFYGGQPGRPVGARTPREALESHERFLVGLLGGPGSASTLALASKQTRRATVRHEVLYFRADGLAVAWVEATMHTDGSWLLGGSSHC